MFGSSIRCESRVRQLSDEGPRHLLFRLTRASLGGVLLRGGRLVSRLSRRGGVVGIGLLLVSFVFLSLCSAKSLGVDNIDVVLVELKGVSFVVAFGSFSILAILAVIGLESLPSLLDLGFVTRFRLASQGVTLPQLQQVMATIA